MSMVFPCTQCGLCCKEVGRTVKHAKRLLRDGYQSPLIKEVAAFPHPLQADGRCSKLGADNRCTIYENRPDICSAEKTWLKYYSDLMSVEKYYALAIKGCNKLIEQAGTAYAAFRINENKNN